MFFIIQANVVDAKGEAAAAPALPKETAAVTVRPADAAVTVFGMVKRQGKYTFEPGMTVQDLLDEAQGLSGRADAAKAQLKRGAGYLSIDLVKEREKALEAGDVLTVREK